MEIIVGTHEEFIIGYEVVGKEDGTLDLKRTFANHSHTGSIRQVAICGNYLVSGGTDELVRIFDLRSRKEVGLLMQHNGTVTDLKFFGKKYLFSAAEDGLICIFVAGKNWQREKTLKSHKGAVNSIAVHPSGKLALSVGNDKTLHTWNLIKGRRAYITNIKKVSELVVWSPDGTFYAVAIDCHVDIYEVATGNINHSVDFKEKVISVVFINDHVMAVGGEGKNICIYEITESKELYQWEAHSLRIKCLVLLPKTEGENVWLASTSSDGWIKVWHFQISDVKSSLKMVGSVDTTCRIICMAVHIPLNTEESDDDSAGSS